MAIVNAPFSLLLRHLSIFFDNYGLALIIFALIVAIIRIPFDFKSKRGTMKQSLLAPKMNAIREKHKNNPQKANLEIQKLFREEGVKPMGGCLWMLMPMIIMIILIGIVRDPLTHLMGLSEYQIDALRLAIESLPGGYTLYASDAHVQVEIASFIRPYFAELQAVVPEIFNLNMNFLGMNIGQIPDWRFFLRDSFTIFDFGLFLMPIFSVATIYLSQKVMMSTNVMQQQMMQQQQSMKTMMMMMPLMSLFFGFTFPAAMSVYWTASSLMFTLVSVFINRHFRGIYKEMTAEMEARDREKEAKLAAKREESERRRALGDTQENKSTSKKKKQLQEREEERLRLAAARAAARDEHAEDEPSRVGHRKFARGRAYEEARYADEQEVLADDELETEAFIDAELDALLDTGTDADAGFDHEFEEEEYDELDEDM